VSVKVHGRGTPHYLDQHRSGCPATIITKQTLRGAPMTAELLIGVDGGNTKTHALVTDGEGTVLGVGHAGTADIHNSEPEPALVEIVRACKRALDAAGATGSDLAAAGFSLAGADWPEDFVLLRDELTRRLGLEREPVIVNDGIGPLRCGSDDSVGVAVGVGPYCPLGPLHSSRATYPPPIRPA